jgi:hypothetical protein
MKIELGGDFFRLGFQKPKSKKLLNAMDGEFNPFGESVDPDLCPRIPKRASNSSG